jgi:hypothetical protein
MPPHATDTCVAEDADRPHHGWPITTRSFVGCRNTAISDGEAVRIAAIEAMQKMMTEYIRESNDEPLRH